MVAALAGPEIAGKLKPVPWNEVGAQVYLPQWRNLVQANTAVLKGLTPESLPVVSRDLKSFGKRFFYASGQAVDEEHAEGLPSAVVGAALTVLLVNRGATLDSAPGRSVSVSVGSIKLEPFSLLAALAAGKSTATDWQQQCADLGIEGLDFAQAAQPDV